MWCDARFGTICRITYATNGIHAFFDKTHLLKNIRNQFSKDI